MDVQTISIGLAAAGVLLAVINQIYARRQATQQLETEIEAWQVALFMQALQSVELA